MSAPVYRRAQHAAHYGHSGGGHDLESWDVIGGWSDPWPDGVPSDAERHHGYIDERARRHVVFVRVAPLTGACRCPGYP